MRILRHTDSGFGKALKGLNRHAAASPQVQATVGEVLEAVQREGDKALIDFTAKFGGPVLKPSQLRVSDAEIAAAVAATPVEVKRALKLSHRNVRDFARKSLRKGWKGRNAQGVEVGERYDAFERVGIYVPGGTAPLVSTAIMTVTLAAAAGVPEIVVTTPAGPDGTVNPALLCALSIAGATEVYRVGGAQAIGALAYGTKSIRRVVKVFGPGNAYVVEAKRRVFGTVAVDLLPGPSEILILADESANPDWIAADLLAQAEHGAGSLALLVTDSARLVDKVKGAIDSQLARLTRRSHLGPVLKDGTWLLQAKDLDQAVEIANGFAPEHVTIMTKDENAISGRIRTAGAIFLGGWSPVAGGDFAAGPSHTLPTGGAGKSFPGLTVDQFQKRTSLIRFSRKSLERTEPIIAAFGEMEGLDAHARSASIRLAQDVK